MISVKKLNKTFNGVIVLNDISTEFENGKTNLIIGQSGSGKTVLLKCILGLFGTNGGEIFFENLLELLFSTKGSLKLILLAQKISKKVKTFFDTSADLCKNCLPHCQFVLRQFL